MYLLYHRSCFWVFVRYDMAFRFRRVTVEVFDPTSTRVCIFLKVKVKVTLRLTVGQSVRLGVEPHLGLMTRYFLLSDSYGLIFVGAPSLTRGRVYLLYILLALASTVFLGSESLGSRDHILPSQF
jgi:hypothetical protein